MVTTGARDIPSLQDVAAGFEFSNTDDPNDVVRERSSIIDNPFFDAEAVSPYLARPLRSFEEARNAVAERRAAFHWALENSKNYSAETKRNMMLAKPRLVWNRDRVEGGRRDQRHLSR